MISRNGITSYDVFKQYTAMTSFSETPAWVHSRSNALVAYILLLHLHKPFSVFKPPSSGQVTHELQAVIRPIQANRKREEPWLSDPYSSIFRYSLLKLLPS